MNAANLIILGWIFGGMLLCFVATSLLDKYYYPRKYKKDTHERTR